MSRFFAPTVESIGHGPSVQAAGDGLEGNYHAFLNSVPTNGKCLVVVPGLDPLHHLEAICPPNAAGSIGDPVLVNVDDDKQLWVVTGTTSLPLTGSAWRTPTLINSWAAFTPVGYLKDAMGFVHMKGILISGVSGTVAFVLPAGFRPGQSIQMPGGTGSGGVTASVVVATSGNVTLVGTPADGIGPDGVTFLAEN